MLFLFLCLETNLLYSNDLENKIFNTIFECFVMITFIIYNNKRKMCGHWVFEIDATFFTSVACRNRFNLIFFNIITINYCIRKNNINGTRFT